VTAASRHEKMNGQEIAVVNLKYYSSKYYTITGIGTRDLPTGLPL
jgi:hypothetical protein